MAGNLTYRFGRSRGNMLTVAGAVREFHPVPNYSFISKAAISVRVT